MDTANELARTAYAGTPITPQLIASVAATHAINSGGHRVRAREYAEAIVASYRSREATLACETAARSVPIIEPTDVPVIEPID